MTSENNFLQQNVSGKAVQVFRENGTLNLYVDGEFYARADTFEAIVNTYNALKERPTIAISINDFYIVEPE